MGVLILFAVIALLIATATESWPPLCLAGTLSGCAVGIWAGYRIARY